METPDDVLLYAEDKMSKSVEVLHDNLLGQRTGKASPSLVENISVEYYGTTQRLKELANISTPEPRLIVINAFDPSSLTQIEKAITAANLGVNPVSDGRVIRVPIPELSEERRKEIVKIAKGLGEDARVAVRAVRREANDQAKTIHKDGGIPEDEHAVLVKEIQELTDQSIKQIDNALNAKEKEIMDV